MSQAATEKQPETVQDKSYISALLQRLVQARQLITVEAEEEGEERPLLTTTLLQILPQQDRFVLDEIFPLNQLDTSTVGLDLRFNVRFEGSQLHFSSCLEEVEQGAVRLLHMRFPQSIDYFQQRDEHRVKVDTLGIPVRITLTDDEELEGVLADVSGCGISIHLKAVTGMKKGRSYPATIEHGDGEPLQVELLPRRLSKLAGDYPLELGAGLKEMNKHEAWMWNRFVAELERRLLRPR